MGFLLCTGEERKHEPHWALPDPPCVLSSLVPSLATPDGGCPEERDRPRLREQGAPCSQDFRTSASVYRTSGPLLGSSQRPDEAGIIVSILQKCKGRQLRNDVSWPVHTAEQGQGLRLPSRLLPSHTPAITSCPELPNTSEHLPTRPCAEYVAGRRKLKIIRCGFLPERNC